jgi:hypothetical protein
MISIQRSFINFCIIPLGHSGLWCYISWGELGTKLNKGFKAIAGLILVFLVHIPRLVYCLLQLSYAAVFHNCPTLAGNPGEHIKRAKKILKKGRLSELLYAALELRFALERMAQRDLLFCTLVSERMLKEYDPTKKVANLHRIAPEAAHAQDFFLFNRATGERFKWAEYRPLNRSQVSAIQGRLGDLLHPKDGLRLGIPDDPWYQETSRFLQETAQYLSSIYKDNVSFFAFEGADSIEMRRIPQEHRS